MTRMILLAAVVGVLAHQSNAVAQQSLYTKNKINALRVNNTAQGFTTSRMQRNVYRQSIPQYNYSAVNQNMFKSALSGRPLQRSAGRSPVSPYMGLSSPFASTGEAYYTQVRPQQDQQRFNQQVASRNAQIQHQLNAMASQSPYQVEGSTEMAPTGHTAVYMNYGGYYPQDTRR